MIIIEKRDYKFSIEELIYAKKVLYQWYIENELKNYDFKSEKERKDNLTFVKYHPLGMFYYLKATQNNKMNFKFIEYLFKDLSKYYKGTRGKKFSLKEILKVDKLYNKILHNNYVKKYINKYNIKKQNEFEYLNLYKSSKNNFFKMLTDFGKFNHYKNFIEFVISEINK